MSALTFPKFSFLDPDFTKTLPRGQVANGVADAFVHVFEQHITLPINAKLKDIIPEGNLLALATLGR